MEHGFAGTNRNNSPVTDARYFSGGGGGGFTVDQVEIYQRNWWSRWWWRLELQVNQVHLIQLATAGHQHWWWWRRWSTWNDPGDNNGGGHGGSGIVIIRYKFQ